MAEDKKSFLMYSDWVTIFEQLEDDEAGKLIKHLFAYVNDRNPSLSDRMLNILFEPIKMQLKRDLKSWEKTKKSKSDGGKMGNLKRYHPLLYQKVIDNQITMEEAESEILSSRIHSHTETNHRLLEDTIASVAVNVNDNVNVNVNDIKKLNISFDDFWDLYDKKKGDKGKVQKKWASLSNKEREKAMAYIPKYKIERPDKIYRKDPIRYLNDKTFNDEIIGLDDQSAGKMPVLAADGTQKEYWEIHYGHMAKTKEEFMELVEKGVITDF